MSRIRAALVATGLAVASALPAAVVLPAGAAQGAIASRERNELAVRLPTRAGTVADFDASRVAVFSSGARAKVAGGSLVTVTDATDNKDIYGVPNPGTLRWAIQYVNSNCGIYGPFTIGFNLSDPPPPIAISDTALDPINCDDTLVDGYSQTGAIANNQAFGSNATIKVALDGTLLTSVGFGSGLNIGANNVEVRGLAIYRFPGHGIETFCGGSGSIFRGNFLGTNPGQASGLGNGGYGISLGDGECGGVDEALIGGPDYSARNAIVNNALGGIHLYRGGASVPAQILRNDVLGNGGPGLVLEGELGTVIGSLTDETALNQFFSNGGPGVVAIPDASSPLTNPGGGHQFGINYTANNTAGIGFDIGGNGPTANDAGDSLPPQNFPQLTSVTFDTATNSMRVVGNLDTGNSGPFTVLLFGLQFPTDYEAGNYLGQFSVPDAATTFDRTLPVSQLPVFYAGITANATSALTGSQSSEISGATISPYVSQDLTAIDFGGVPLGSSASRTVSISNAAAFEISSATPPLAGFTVDVSSCAPVVSPDTSCSIGITFAPSVAGPASASADFVSNSAGLQRLSLAGVGMAPPTVSMGFSPSSISASSSSTLTITLTNPNSRDIIGTAFSNTYTTSGLVNAASPGPTTTCAGGSVSATGGGNSLALSEATIPAGSSCTVSVSVTSAAAGSYTDTLAAGAVTTTNAGSSTGAATATLTVTASSVSLSTTSLVFGSQIVGTTSSPQIATLANMGTTPLGIASIVSSTGDFSMSTSCPTSLLGGASCTISVTFAPLAIGARTGSIVITDDAVGSPRTISLTGVGATSGPLNPSVTPSSLVFPDQNVGTLSALRDITLRNTGSATLTVSAVELVGTGFAVRNECSAPVLPGASCRIRVLFAPTRTGVLAATLRIVTNGTAAVVIVGISGRATPALVGQLSATPASLSFGDQFLGTTSPGQTFVLTNTGNATTSISGISATGDFAVAGTCADLLPGNSCTLQVVFSPTALGTRAGQVVVTSNAANSPLAIGFSGSGIPVPAPRVLLSPSNLTFGDTLVGAGSTQAVTVTNVGTADLVFGPMDVTREYRITNGCPGTLAPSQSCRIDVGFAPSIPGQHPGEVRISSNAEGSPHHVNLSGVGCRFALTGRSFALVCGP